MPTPAPTSAIEARPAPINFAAEGSITSLPYKTEVKGESVASMMHVQRIVEVDASEDGEHIGLEESDQDLKPGESHHEAERRPAAEEPEGHHEGAEHFQHGVAGHH